MQGIEFKVGSNKVHHMCASASPPGASSAFGKFSENSLGCIALGSESQTFPEGYGMKLAKGATVNAKSRDGMTALMSAAAAGHTDAVQVLLEQRPNVNAKAENGATALMAAAVSGHADVVRILLDNDAAVDVKVAGGQTALMLAGSNGHTD